MIRLEPATLDDAQTLCDLMTKTFDDDAQRWFGIPQGGPPRYDELSYHQELVEGRAWSDPHVYHKIIFEDRIVGGLVVFPNDSSGRYCLGSIYIDPDYQDRHLGSEVMRLIEETYPHARKWVLDTPSCCTRNHHFYEKHGYVKVGEGGPKEDSFFMYEKVMVTSP